GVSIPQYAGWVLGTAVGVLIGPVLGDPKALGLDALFPAFFLALLFEEARGRRRVAAAAGGAGIALVLTPILPAGLPILAASAAAGAPPGQPSGPPARWPCPPSLFPPRPWHPPA